MSQETTSASATEPPAPPPPPALAPLEPGPGVRVVLDTRGFALAALPTRVVVLDDDFRFLRALDARTGDELWRTEVQQNPRGRHDLYAVGDRVLLHAGPDRIVVDAVRGELIGRHFAGGYNGSEDSCRFEIVHGFTGSWEAHAPLDRDATACATVCKCSLQLFRCDTGAPVPDASFHGSVTHIYPSLGEAHDSVCFTPPRLLGQVKGRTLLALERGDRDHVGVALGRDGKEVWRRPALSPALGRHRGLGGDLASDTCWSVESEDMFIWTCSTGHITWRAAFPGEADAWDSEAHLVAPGRLLVRRRSKAWLRVELRDAASGKRLWRRELPPGHVPLAPGEDPSRLVRDAGSTIAWIDPSTGATLRELALTPDQGLVRAPTGGYLRYGGADVAELDREGQPQRTVPKDIRGLAWVGARLVVARDGERLAVLRRPEFTEALALTGTWSVAPATAALGPDALLLYEHRGQEPLRVVLLRATD